VHVWISHEFPDHLSIPTIKALSSGRKARMVVLFQRHYDTEVINWIRTQGFKEVHELPHALWIELSSRCRVACYRVGHMDSALAIKGEGRTIPNLNDCDTPAASLSGLARKSGPCRSSSRPVLDRQLVWKSGRRSAEAYSRARNSG
jgi:hypothetical protein